MTGTYGAEPRSVARVRAGLWLGAAIAPSVVVLAVIYAAGVGAAAKAQRETGQAPVVQDVSESLWNWSTLTAGGVARVLALGPSALLAAMPGSLLLLLLWRRPASGATDTGAMVALRAPHMARAVAWTCLSSLAVLTVLGVGNPRYAMPSVCFVPMLAGHAWSNFAAQVGRTGVAWQRLKWGTWAVVGMLLAGAGVWIVALEPRERARSGREAGLSMAGALPDGAMVWADGMVEARPEVLWYAQQEAARQGRTVTPAWIPHMAKVLAVPRHGYVLMRTDGQDPEEAAYRAAGLMDRFAKVWEGGVHKYSCALYRKD